MTRDFCHRIMDNDNVEGNMASAIKNIIFKVGDLETQILQMERYGYHRDGYFCFISMFAEDMNGVHSQDFMDTLEFYAEKTARSIHELFISFSYKDCLILLLVDYSNVEIETFVKNFLKLTNNENSKYSLHLGISSNQQGLYKQDKNFERAFSSMEMAIKRKETCNYYDQLDIYKVLFAVNDKSVLRSYYRDTIGKLELYDNKNSTELMKLLTTYFENNGSLQLVSEKLFVHRNTVTNQLKKIESITGYNPTDMEDRVKLYMGLYIKDIL